MREGGVVVAVVWCFCEERTDSRYVFLEFGVGGVGVQDGVLDVGAAGEVAEKGGCRERDFGCRGLALVARWGRCWGECEVGGALLGEVGECCTLTGSGLWQVFS